MRATTFHGLHDPEIGLDTPLVNALRVEMPRCLESGDEGRRTRPTACANPPPRRIPHSFRSSPSPSPSAPLRGLCVPKTATPRDGYVKSDGHLERHPYLSGPHRLAPTALKMHHTPHVPDTTKTARACASLRSAFSSALRSPLSHPSCGVMRPTKTCAICCASRRSTFSSLLKS